MNPILPPLTDVLELVPDAVCVVDTEGRYLFVNASFERIFGYRPEEVLGRRMIDLVHPDDREPTLRAAARVMEGHLQRHFRNRYLRKDGRVVDVQWSARWSAINGVRIAVGHEIGELRRAEEVQAALLAIAEAAHTESDLTALLARIHRAIGSLLPADNVHVAMLEPGGRILAYPYWHDRVATKLPPGRLEDDVLVAEVVRTGRSVVHDTRDGDAAAQVVAVPLTTVQGVIGALVVRSAGPLLVWNDADRQRLEFVASQVAAACERSRHRQLLEYLAGHDPLTGLANRHRLRSQLDHVLNEARAAGTAVALLYLDLDGFKAANDTCGHEGGDVVLREVARRLRDTLRQGDAVARLGGDEFVILLPGCGADSAARGIADKVRETLREPFRIGEHALQLSVSIGIAAYPGDGVTPDALLRQADRAMYAAKRAGGNRLAAAPDATTSITS
jgi:diguanylate cyclase (GGDEF)-like protein/PAS domain S-box-containing protein